MNTPKIVSSSDDSSLSQHREDGRQLLFDLVKELVTDSSSIQVSLEVGEGTTVYHVACSKDCIGQILGSKGKNISAVRTLIGSVSARKGFRAIVEIPFFRD
nr:hypothetical protein HAGR004_07930 [Bdellovibrio sp. HAGR004]